MLFLSNDRGFTLTELLIAIVISLILLAAATATYISQNRSYVAHESVSEVNTQSKIAHDLIANEVKSAGFGVPDDLNANPINGMTNVVTPSDNAGAGGSDAVTIISGRMLGQLWPVGVGPGTTPCPAAPNEYKIPAVAAVDIIYSGTLRPNTTDMSNLSIDTVEFATASSVANPGFAVTLSQNLGRQYPLFDTDGDGMCDTGRPVYLIEDITFCVDAGSLLRRIRRNAALPGCTGIGSSNNEVLAENVEDLQLTYAVDNNSDGQIDDQDGSGMLDAGDFLNGNDPIITADPSIIRAVQVNVLARTDKPDVNFTGLGNPPALVANNPHATTNDNFKRRWWQTIITIRNQ
ncbi:MAG: PilW family protein [Nitrospirae bacterium]|nr:PilW family protein [Nitrospirota bacterium]